MDIKTVTDRFAVSAQIAASDLAEVAARGFVRIINNRPDNETPGQPTSAEMEAAANVAGLDYVWIPIVGAPAPAQADAMAIASKVGKTMAFCRSGTRSINTWALGQVRAGAMALSGLVAAGRGAGYDLSWLNGAGR